MEEVEEEEEVAEEEGDEVKVEGWAGAAVADAEDEYGSGDEDASEKEEEAGKRCEMRLFPERQATSAPSPPLRSARDRGGSCGWRRNR